VIFGTKRPWVRIPPPRPSYRAGFSGLRTSLGGRRSARTADLLIELLTEGAEPAPHAVHPGCRGAASHWIKARPTGPRSAARSSTHPGRVKTAFGVARDGASATLDPTGQSSNAAVTKGMRELRAHGSTCSRPAVRFGMIGCSSGLLDVARLGINLRQKVSNRRFHLTLAHSAAVGPRCAEP